MAQKMEIKGLDKLLKMLKDKSKPFIRIGILGANATATHEPEDGGEQKTFATNAEIGAAHEYGTVHLPVRSFLRVPLSTNLNKALSSAGALDKETMEKVLKDGTIMPWLEKTAIVAESVVAEAFDTGGGGMWPESNMDKKKNHQTLVESQQLRNSITSEIKKNG